MTNKDSLPGTDLPQGKAARKIQTYFNKEFIIKNTLWFALITVATIAGIFFYNRTGDTIEALGHIKFKFIPICCVMLFIDLMLGSWRNHIYVQKLKPGISHWVSFKANVANMFMGAVTPAHGGAGPAQMYVYMRHGLSFSDSFAITLINFGATLIYMPLAGFAAILLMDQQYAGSILPSLLKYAFTFFALFLVAFILAFWKPLWMGVIIKKIAETVSRILPRKKLALLAWADRSLKSIAQYQQTCSIIIYKNPFLFPLSIIMTFVMYFNKYCMQYFILLGLGVQADLMQVVSMQVLIQLIIYFVPTPGGSGFAEIGISVLFGKIVPVALLPLFTLLQRSFLLFFPAMIGAYFLLSLLHQQARGRKKQVTV